MDFTLGQARAFRLKARAGVISKFITVSRPIPLTGPVIDWAIVVTEARGFRSANHGPNVDPIHRRDEKWAVVRATGLSVLR